MHTHTHIHTTHTHIDTYTRTRIHRQIQANTCYAYSLLANFITNTKLVPTHPGSPPSYKHPLLMSQFPFYTHTTHTAQSLEKSPR